MIRCIANPVEDILFIYRIFFQLLNKKEISEIKDDAKFWELSCAFFMNNTNLDENKPGKEKILTI